MSTNTTNYSLVKPAVNSATDQDIWGNELNNDLDSIDSLLKAGITNSVQSTQTTGFSVSASISIKYLYLCDATGGGFSATLPAAATAANGATVYIKKTDSSVNAVTVARSGSDTIDGSTSYSITGQNQVVAFTSDGSSKWYVSADGQISLSDASTTTKGIVELATDAELQTGTDTTRAITPSNILAAIGFSKLYTSSDQTITLSGTATLAHGIGRVPAFVQCFLVCQIADMNYSANDVVVVNPAMDLTSTQSGAVSITIDATNLNVRYGGSAPQVLNKTSGTASNIDITKWKLRIKAWG